ncbi:MAG: tRNA pseudouridine(13) synthase TruD [Marinagarivorans sp.]|nr:tRNA pseudouridine(13) synthase TruD [Marinagarivorans sp.]
MTFDLAFPWANGSPRDKALLKGENAHFFVAEDLGFTPAGIGEHLYLQLESSGDNTQWLADVMAEVLAVQSVDVGFCGLKDRNAMTQQWFSLYDPKREVEARLQTKMAELQSRLPSLRVLQKTRGAAKLRRGDHAGNHFVITLVLDEPAAPDLKRRLAHISDQGVPNYFGLQRFGRDGNNLNSFAQWLQAEAQLPINKRNKRRKPTGIILSAARSWLFNQVLAARVQAGNWRDVLSGDVLIDTNEQAASAPLWGRGRSATADVAFNIECQALAPFMSWANALEHFGLQQERRALVCKPVDFQWRLAEQHLTLSFFLPPGAYATTVLRELCDCYEPDRHQVKR